VVQARSCEFVDGVWTIPAERTKNSVEHRIALGPWGQRLMQSESEWVLPSPRGDGPRSTTHGTRCATAFTSEWRRLRVEQFPLFSARFPATARSNTKRLRVDYETAEAMLNHVKKGMERTYDQYALRMRSVTGSGGGSAR
jgi:hypothetical protein